MKHGFGLCIHTCAEQVSLIAERHRYSVVLVGVSSETVSTRIGARNDPCWRDRVSAHDGNDAALTPLSYVEMPYATARLCYLCTLERPTGVGPISSARRGKATGRSKTDGGISYLLSRRGNTGVLAMLQSFTRTSSASKVQGP